MEMNAVQNEPAPPAVHSSRLWRWTRIGIVVAVTSLGTWAVLEYVVLSKLPRALVGKWVVDGGEQEGATFDFYRNGRMIGRMNVKGREGIIDARVRVDGDKLLTTTRNPKTGQKETRPQSIQVLTERNMTLVDEQNQILRLKRAE